MSDAVIAQKGPFGTDVTEGRKYFWCACGRSRNQPFCDGSHKVTEITPVEFTAPRTGQLFFCGCKHSKNPPLCDGTHNTL